MSEAGFKDTVNIYKKLFGESLIEEMNASLPTEPGKYKDGGDEWTLREDGRWEDSTGDSRPADWNFVLVITGFNPVKVV